MLKDILVRYQCLKSVLKDVGNWNGNSNILCLLHGVAVNFLIEYLYGFPHWGVGEAYECSIWQSTMQLLCECLGKEYTNLIISYLFLAIRLRAYCHAVAHAYLCAVCLIT